MGWQKKQSIRTKHSEGEARGNMEITCDVPKGIAAPRPSHGFQSMTSVKTKHLMNSENGNGLPARLGVHRQASWGQRTQLEHKILGL